MGTQHNVIVCVVLICLVTKSYSFLPAKISGDPGNMFTHTEITESGFYQAAAMLLKSQNLVPSSSADAITEFFGSDHTARAQFDSVITKVISYSNSLQRTKFKEAKYSVNGEQIQEAHDFIVQTKNEIRNLLKSNFTSISKDLILQKIGHCLFVIQSFYSNTNWVEMRGSTPYTDFGVDGIALMPISSSFENTCKNCGPIGGNSCVGNIIVRNVLTSGYRSGQDIYKVQFQSSTEGKCSHGGPSDSSRTIPATGGINKDTPDITRSPHGHLHQSAADAAISATVDFLVNKERGLLSFCSIDIFTRLLDLIRRTTDKSLSFSIDTTGSMSDDISGAKASVKKLIMDTQGTDNEPSNYVLATFNDPDSLTTGNITKNVHEFLTWIDLLSVDGGGDCPEYSMSGLLEAISLSKNGSTVYHFTDADAKDCYRLNEVAAAAGAKHVKLQFLLTGSCSGFVCHGNRTKRNLRLDRRSNIHVHKRSSLFDTLAEATGGAVHQAGKSEISKMLDSLLKKDLPSSVVLIEMFVLPTSSSPDDVFIYLDADMQKANIVLEGPTSFDEVLLKDPSGTIPSFGSGGNVTRVAEASAVMFSIQRPTPGRWSIERKIKRMWNIKVTSDASIDFRYSFLETDENGFSHEIAGNPISGKTYSLKIIVVNMKEIPDASQVVILDVNRNTLTTMHLTLSTAPTGHSALTSIQVPDTTFYVQIRCQYKDTNLSFRRISKHAITPVTVQLSHSPLLGDLFIGEEHELHYTIRNSGSSSEDVTVRFDDNMAGLSVQSVFDHTLRAGEEESGTIRITGKTTAVPIEYTITVLKKTTGEVLQTVKGHIMFTDIGHPRCTVLSQTGDCSLSEDCKAVTWTATARISFSGVQLLNISYSNAGSDVIVQHDNFDKVTGPNIKVDVRGSCCSPNVVLIVVDTQRYSCKCMFTFSDATKHRFSDDEVTKTYADDGSDVNVGLIVGVVLAVAVVIMAIVSLVIYRKTFLLVKTKTESKETIPT